MAVLILALLGCADIDPPLVPFSNEPMLYLVLHPQTDSYGLGSLNEFALLAETGSPTQARFIIADSFVMMRESDGALFDWSLCREGPLIITPEGLDMREANYCLLEDGGGDRLGAAALAPGESYTLSVTTGFGTIEGDVVVPDTFSISIIDQDGSTAAAWAAVAGAAAYSVSLQSGGSFVSVDLTTDTIFPIPDGIATGSVIVYAFDANLTHFLGDPAVAASGLIGANGLLGAVVEASVSF